MRRLHFLIWQERLRAAVPLLLAAVLIGGIGALVILDSTVIERSSVHGDVASWSRVQTETGSATYVIGVTLADGNSVTATASRYGRAPRIGERLELTRTRTGIGRIRYEWAN
jgi:hypothetical protein